METRDGVKFREVQRFGKWVWGVAGFTGVVLILAGRIVVSWLIDSPKEWRSEDVVGLIVGGVCVAAAVGVDVLLIKARLETEVREDGLYIRFFPPHRSFRKIPLENVVKVEARTYRPLREYGGWGIRCGRGGRAYNMSGNVGVRIDYANGRHLLIGSKRAEELAEAIGALLKDKGQR